MIFSEKDKLLDACRTLKDYSEYTARVRKYAETMSLVDAVERAITECIREGILAEFLSLHKAEVKNVSIYEYDAEKHMHQERGAEYERGFDDGIEKGKLQLIQKKLKLDKDSSLIADELEESEESIRQLIKEHNLLSQPQ